MISYLDIAVYVFVCRYIAERLKKGCKKFSQFLQILKHRFLLKYTCICTYTIRIYFKYIISSTSIQDMKMSSVPSKLRQISIFKNRENTGSNRPSVPSACCKRRLSTESVKIKALIQLALAVEVQQEIIILTLSLI